MICNKGNENELPENQIDDRPDGAFHVGELYDHTAHASRELDYGARVLSGSPGL